MNHKNFSVFTCSHLLVALKLQSTTIRLTLVLFLLQTNISSSNFTSLSFLKLVKELLFFVYFADFIVRLRILASHNHKVAAALVARLP